MESKEEKKVFFAKIIELPKNQVLVIKTKTDSEEAPYALRVETDIRGKRIGINYGFAEQTHVDEAFSSFLMKDAEKVVEDINLRLDEGMAINYTGGET